MSFEEIYNLDFEYTNEGEGSIGRDFIRPCLKACSVYRRHTAFFRITALNFWSSAFTHLIKDNVKIELMTSMVVDDPNVIRALKLNKTEQDRKDENDRRAGTSTESHHTSCDSHTNACRI